MDIIAEKIIASINKHYPRKDQPKLKNCSDLQIEAGLNYTYQFIIGVTPKDKFSGGIDYYEFSMKNALAKFSFQFNCLPLGFMAMNWMKLKQSLEYCQSIMRLIWT